MRSPRQAVLVIGDIASMIAGFFLFAFVSYPFGKLAPAIQVHRIPFAILGVIWLVILFVFNAYDLRASKPTMVFLRRLGFAAIAMFVAGIIFFYLYPHAHITPKTNLAIFESFSIFLIMLWRRIFYLISINSFHTKFAIVCTEEFYHSLVSEIAKNPHIGFKNIGTYRSLVDFNQENPQVDLLIVHKTSEAESKLMEQILASHIEVIDLAEAYETILYKIPVAFIDTAWVIRSITKTSRANYLIFSRALSVIIATILLVGTSPISLAIIIAIIIEDHGPILIRQNRVGLHGKIFKLYKFRSMIATNTDGQAEVDGAVWAAGAHDPRITKIGAVTRRLHIDEIPQLINVLKGDIALVGPRPERPEFVKQLEQEIPYYFMRHTINPGFTGWAQIKFRYARSVMDSREKFEYDLFYIKNRNFFLDIGIILKTIQIIFTH